jgi:4-amino-4-deoxy-L-arabinose transferase-like glycosyltransferase
LLPIIGWGVLAFTVFFWRLGATSFWDPDEAHYAQATRELIASGDWLTPYYNDEPFFDKPILFYLLQAIPMTFAGPTETAARVVPAPAALAIVGWTWWLGRTLVSREVGFVAALLLTANPAVFALARYAILDTVFTAFLFGGVALITVAALTDRARLQYGGYVLIALATLTKGPLALVLCGVTFLVAIAVSADARRRLLRLRWILGVAIVILLSAPWFLVMLQRHGQAFVDGYLLKENLLLFSSRQYSGQPRWWFYLQILPVALLPWSGLALGRLYDDLRGVARGGRLDTFEVLLWAWIAAIVGFFSFSQFKLDHYVFPAAPALCLLSARAWAHLRTLDGREHVGARFGSLASGPVLVLAGLTIAFLMIDRLDLPRLALAMPVAIVALGSAVTSVSIRRPRPPAAPWLSVSAMGVLYAGVLLWVVPSFDEKKVVPDVARWVASHAGDSDRVAAYLLNRWSPSFRFYVGRHTTFLQGPDTAPDFFSQPEPFYVVMLEPAYLEFVAKGIPLRVVYARDGMWVTSGRALWRQKEAPARFVVVTRAEAR